MKVCNAAVTNAHVGARPVDSTSPGLSNNAKTTTTTRTKMAAEHVAQSAEGGAAGPAHLTVSRQ